MSNRAGSTGKKVIFGLLLGGLCLVAVELLGAAALWFQSGAPSGSGIEARQRQVVAAQGAGFGGEQMVSMERGDGPPKRPGRVMHPYTGYVHDGGGPELELESLSGEDLTVVIIGGSVAAAQARRLDTLREGLSSVPALQDQELTFVDLAIAGMKQPQQLMTLTYLISLGAEFDIVINLDGFNELAVSTDLADIGVYPHYSHAWPFKVQGFSDEQLKMVGEIVSIRERRASAAARALGFPFRHSSIAALGWSVYDDVLVQKLADLEISIAESARDPRQKSGDEFDYQARGPWTERYDRHSAVFEDVARVWANSSITMKQLSDANGFDYFHFLQPNQYLAKKPMSPAERAIAYASEEMFGDRVREGYLSLRRAAERIRAADVHYYDLTDVFSDTSEAVYRDGCCHVNKLGRDLIGRAMARHIASAY